MGDAKALDGCVNQEHPCRAEATAEGLGKLHA
jgi:hypothetical protein